MTKGASKNDKSTASEKDGEGETASDLDALTASARARMEAMEAFGRAVTSAAMASQTSWMSTAADPDAAARARDPDPFNLNADTAKVLGKLAHDPSAMMDAQMRLWRGYMDVWAAASRRATGDADASPAIAPERGDKRWRSEEWTANPMFDAMRQTYLMTSRWLLDTLESVEGVDEATKKRVTFFARQLSDAFSPTNFPLTNPDVVKATMEEGGDNLLRGMRQFADDLERGGGKLAISQTDLDRFEVGRDVATAPGQVVYRNRLFELIHFAPTTEQVHARPLLIFPPWINKFYILDLQPANSMVRWLTDQGHAVFLTSWVNPDASLADVSFEDYMREGIFEALDATLKQTGADKANTVGYCIGGTLLSSTLAYMAKTGDDRIASATFFAAQADFSDAGDLQLFTGREWLEEIERRMDANGGVLDGQTMSDTFNMLRANDLIWSFMVNNYFLGKAPRPFDLLFWNADQTRLGKTLHLFYLDQFYGKNALAEGNLELGGEHLAISDIVTPCFFQASKEDHIAPFGSVYRGARQTSGPTRFMLSGSGHIAGVINHPDAKKYQHWVNETEKLPKSVDTWLAGAREEPGSWWPAWDAWLTTYAGDDVPAIDPKKGPLEPIEPAPGSYVKVKS